MRPTFRWSLLALIALLAGCAAPAPLSGPAPTAAPADRFALQIIADVAPILAALPPDLAAAEAPPAPADPAVLAAWAHPTERWRESAQRAGALDGEDAAAAAPLLDAALNDGLALAEAARVAGHAVSDDAVLAEVAWRLIAYAHPLRADAARADAQTATWAGCWRGEASAPGVITGRLLGAAVAEAVIAQKTPAALGATGAGE